MHSSFETVESSEVWRYLVLRKIEHMHDRVLPQSVVAAYQVDFAFALLGFQSAKSNRQFAVEFLPPRIVFQGHFDGFYMLQSVALSIHTSNHLKSVFAGVGDA